MTAGRRPQTLDGSRFRSLSLFLLVATAVLAASLSGASRPGDRMLSGVVWRCKSLRSFERGTRSTRSFRSSRRRRCFRPVRSSRVVLKEPSKSDTLAWKPGQPFSRQSLANVFDPARNKLFEAVVDLRAKKLVSWVERPNTQPPVYTSEYQEVDDLVRADPRWRKAMKDRDIKPRTCTSTTAGRWAADRARSQAGDRLLRALSFFQGPLPNPYDRPIEGVLVDVDLNKLAVAGFVDTGIRPVNKTISGGANTTRSGLQPLIVTQPNGPSFQLDGNAVAWQGWHFRVGFMPREGLVLYQIGYEQKGVVRPIMYRISLDEIYVPYGTPDPSWAWRAALDIGEYNLGQWAEPLEANVDVPANAVFFDAVAATDTADSANLRRAPRCRVVRAEAGSLWDRTDPTSGERDARLARELVVSAAYAQGNYTYGTSYVFRMDGGIDVRVMATGTTLNQGVRSADEGDRFGTTVAQNVAAPSHQHFFNFRIDFDVDGTRNRLVEENIRSADSPARNAFVADRKTLGSEQFRDFASGRSWVVESLTKVNALGEPTAYELRPLDTVVPC